MAGNPIKVLFIEDNEDHAFLIIHELKKGGYDPTLKRVDTMEDVRASLDSEGWDVLLCDYSLPGFNGVNVIEEYRKRNLDYPFIIVPGESPIVPIMLYDAKLAQAFSQDLYDEGVFAVGFFFPVVAQGQARIRTQLSAAHNIEHLERALDAFVKIGSKFNILGKTKDELLQMKI